MIEISIGGLVLLSVIICFYIFRKPSKRKQFSDYFIGKNCSEISDNSTIMFISLKEYKRLTEVYYPDHKKLDRILNSLSTKIIDIVNMNDGQIYLYDSNNIVVSWSNKFDEFQQHTKAVNSAFEINEELDKANKISAIEGLYPIKIGIGISHNLNLSKSLEEFGKKYGLVVIMDSTIPSVIDDSYIIFDIDNVYVDSNTISIFTVVDYALTTTSKYAQLNANQHKRFILAYRERRFETAGLIASTLKTSWNEKMVTYYSLMMTRCRHLRVTTPTYSWNGVYTK